MKSTQITELFANIKKTFVSFFSILMFVALGVGIFLGISWVAPALQNASDEIFDEGAFHDFQIQFPYGLTDDDLKQLADVDGVSDIEPGYIAYQSTITGNKKSTVKLQSMGERINTLTIVEGELPAKADEIVLSAEAANELGIEVGNSIMFEHDATDDDTMTALSSMDASADGSQQSTGKVDEDGMKYLNGSTYKVTGLVHSPEYLATSSETYGYSPTVSGKTDAVGWVLPAAFDPAAFQDAYPVVNVRCDSLRGVNSFSGDYAQKATAIKERITELGTKLADARYDDLHGQAQAKIDDAQAKLDDAKQKIADGEKQIADGEKALEDGKAELESKRAQGQAELDAAYQKLINGEAEYQAGLAEYNSYKAEYDSVVSTIEGVKAEVSSMDDEYRQIEKDKKSGKIDENEYNKRMDALANRANAELEPARRYYPDIPKVDRNTVGLALEAAYALLENYRDVPFEINGKTMTLNEAEQELNAAKAKLDAGRADLDNGWGQYYAGQAEYEALVAEGEQKIADGEKELEDAKQQVADAKQQVAENEPKLEQAKEQLAAMKDYSWTVSARADNAGRINIAVFSDVTTNLSFSMALLFVIVGLLVSYSAVSRIVHEQITQIGTKKALGLRKREITLSFLLYAGIAVLVGAIVGTIVGVIAVEGIIANALSSMFIFGNFPPYFGLGLFLIVTLLELALVLVATYLACHGILKKHAVELLRGEEPPKAKTRFYEKWKIWEKLPLFVQTIVNNCVNDKRRVFSTVVGVAGCTALIVTAITLNNDVLKSYDRHYENVYGFADIAYVDTSIDGAIDKVEEVYWSEGSKTAQLMRSGALIKVPNGGSAAVYIDVPADADAFAQVYHINPVSGVGYDPSAKGVWMSQAYAEHFGTKVGDEVEVDLADGVVHKMPVLGFYEFWLTYHEMVIAPDYYKEEFGTDPLPNTVIASEHDASTDEMTDKLSKVEGFDSVVDDKTYQYGNFATFSTVSSAVVLIYLVLSALMALVVLLNLNMMFIDEKKRELIVLMINGFSVKDAKKYIYSDTIVLTAIGIILGIILGCIMGAITVGSMEPSTASFVKDVDLVAVVVGIAGSALLATIMCIISLRRIPKFDLTDINKF